MKIEGTPKFWTWLFKKLCSNSFYEELQGDLEENFSMNCQSKGSRKAKSIYRKEVIKMIRPSVIEINKSLPSPIRFSLFKIHLILSFRNLKRNKVFSLITTFGFAAAISISLFLINLIYSGFAIDKQHTGVDRIFRIATKAEVQGEKRTYASTPIQLANQVSEKFPDFEVITQINRTLESSFEVNGVDIKLNGLYTDENFFQVFNFKIISGDVQKVFKDISSVAITERAAQRLFYGQNPIGQLTKQGHVVRAVIESPKNKSHIPFDIITNIEAFNPPLQGDISYTERNYLYGRVLTAADIENVSAKLLSFSASFAKDNPIKDTNYSFFLQSVTGIVFKDGVFNEIGSSVGKEGLIAFSTLTFLLMAMACFNYTNLSIARALQRTKEVGIRKVAGSTRTQIISQFLIETLLFSSIGFVIGLAIYVYYSSSIIDLIPFPFVEVSNLNIIFIFISFGLVAGLSAGLVPAFLFAKISPLALFNKGIQKGVLSFQNLRKFLVGFQLTLSMFSIVFLSLVIDQYSNLKEDALGFDKENLLIVSGTPQTSERLIQSFTKISGVTGASQISVLPGVDFPQHLTVFTKLKTDSITTRFFNVDYRFNTVFKPKLKLGHFFSSPSTSTNRFEVVVSSELLEKLKINEEEALGTIIHDHSADFQIIGVFDQTLLSNPLVKQERDLMVINRTDEFPINKIVLRIESPNNDKMFKEIQSTWEDVFPEGTFHSAFVTSQIKSAYSDLLNFIKIISFIGGCIILISLLGQLGIALYSAQSKVKEIGIRKVLGAKLNKILHLILRSTFITITTATLIAVPIAYLLFQNAVASEMRTPLEITLWALAKGVILIASVVLSVVISQTWRVSNMNPAKSLSNE